MARTIYFPDLSQQLQGALWQFDSVYDLGNGTALAIDYPDYGNPADTCPNHRPIVAVISLDTGEELIRKEL
ncbi:MAG: hypothetical protein LAO23_05265 [Acidobacteriia bacterium]|nr:hypothetical protein [Terriglobia bacterium]